MTLIDYTFLIGLAGWAVSFHASINSNNRGRIWGSYIGVVFFALVMAVPMNIKNEQSDTPATVTMQDGTKCVITKGLIDC